jgi:hypothetical protein
VIRLRQPVERPHPEEGGQRRAEDRRLEHHRNELRPADHRAAADVHRIRDGRHPDLERKSPEAAGDAAEQHEQRQPCSTQIERLVQFLDRNGRVRVHLAIAGETRLGGSLDETGGAVELGHQPVERGG